MDFQLDALDTRILQIRQSDFSLDAPLEVIYCVWFTCVNFPIFQYKLHSM